jgi:hypothetical protein
MKEFLTWLALPLCLAVVACGDSSDASFPKPRDRFFPEEGDTLALVAFAVADTVFAGEPAEVVLVLRGGSEPVRVRDQPEGYSLVIVDSQGDTVRSSATMYDSGLYGDEPLHTIPRRGFVGRVIDLNCVVPQYGGQNVAERPCMLRFALTKGERYRIEARFRSLAGPVGSEALDLRAAPFDIVVVERPKPHP